MNLYFLVEGKRTESIVYPAWLSILVPELERIYDPFAVMDNQYYLFDGGGYPNILKDMINALYDINETGRYDYLVVCLDADDESISSRVASVKEKIAAEGIVPSCQVEVIVQKKCIETWFLGNREMYTPAGRAKGSFRKFSAYYNVYSADPELMEKPFFFGESTAQYHYRYLEAMLREKGIRYSKSRPYCVCGENYINSLLDRIRKTDDLNSFRFFVNFCTRIRRQLLSRSQAAGLSQDA